MAATVQVAESLSQVQPRIMQTSTSKKLSRMCTKEDEPRLWLCVSLGDCPGTCSKAVFAAKDLSKTCPLSRWDAWSSSKLELLRLVPELKQCCGGCVLLQTYLDCCQPGAGPWHFQQGRSAGSPSAPAAPSCSPHAAPSTAPLLRLLLRVQRWHLQDTPVCWTGQSGTAAPGSQHIFLPQPGVSTGFCTVHRDKGCNKSETLPFH